MTIIPFDSLDSFDKIKKAGLPEQQARAQIEIMQGIVKSYEAESRKELATKGDLADAKHEILKWIIAAMIAQTALIVAVIGVVAAFLIK